MDPEPRGRADRRQNPCPRRPSLFSLIHNPPRFTGRR
jgi:hypothetical protein